MFSLDDTIAAIATPLGVGGVGIVKISGDEALPIIQQIFVSPSGVAKLRPRYLHFGAIVEPQSRQRIDEALVAYMPGPHSYTRQDVVEIQAHGGIVPLQQILQAVFSLGARPAEAGEMTLRAFINGRLDLTQAEAVLDIIQAKTEAGLRIAARQLSGSLSGEVSQVRQALVNVLAFLEASIDFVEEDIPLEEVAAPLEAALAEIEQLLTTASQGLIYRQGVRAAIIGRPNVGKSSLLNALLRGERAIVTNIPGTTRDTLEETANIGGIPLVLVDTAGIRSEPGDAVEQIGIDRSRAALAQADLALLVIDRSEGLTEADREIAALVGGKPVLLILNKMDLPQSEPLNGSLLPAAPRIPLSALTGEGLDRLEALIVEQITGGQVVTPDAPVVSSPRHKALLTQTTAYIRAAIQAQVDGLSPDLVAIDVREAVDALGQITGESATEDLLNTIFSKFCIGK